MRRGTSRSWAFVGAVFVVLSALSPSSGSSAAIGSVVDDGWIPSTPPDVVGYQGVSLMDRPDYTELASALRGWPNRTEGGWKSCSSLADANCRGVEVIEFSALLQPCATATSLDCISEFGVIGTDGTKIPAAFQRSFPAEAYNKYPADPSKNLPVGAPGGLWLLPSSAALADPLHFVRVSVLGTAKPGDKFRYVDFGAAISAVTMGTRQCNDFLAAMTPNGCTPSDTPDIGNPLPGYSGYWDNLANEQNLDCVMSGNPDRDTDTAECALRRAMSTETTYYLGVRLTQSPQGWLHGRLADGDVAIDGVPGVPGAIELSVRGKPIRVPFVHVVMPFTDLPTDLKPKYSEKGSWPSSTGGSGYHTSFGLPDTDAKDGTRRNRLSIPPSYGPDGIAELQAWLPHVKDTATADRATWSVRTLREWERERTNDCLNDSDRLTGLVLTNATQYAGGAPVYNTAAKSLDYKVAAPHYMSSGELFKGSYQLMMRSDVARCMYGFVGDAIKATVSVLESGSGETSTAVTTVAETNGWLRLSATGYTHSAPTIRAKIIERKASLKVARSITDARVARTAGLTVPSGAKVTLKVPSRHGRNCRVRGASVVGTRTGSCAVTVTVTHAGKRSTKTLRIQVG